MRNTYKIFIISLTLAAISPIAYAETPEKLYQQLDRGARGEDVILLQKTLSADPSIYPEGLITGYYGSLTEKAVKTLQQRHGLEMVGRVGPKTLVRINELVKQVGEDKPKVGLTDSTTSLKPTESVPSSKGTDAIAPTYPIADSTKADITETETTEETGVIIRFAQRPGQAEEALVRNAGGAVRRSYKSVPAVAAKMPRRAIEALLKNPNIQAIDIDQKIRAHDLELDSAWGVKRIGAGNVHASGNSGVGVKIAVIDSGIDYNHPDLKVNYAGGYNFINNTNDPFDDNGHGTHVAGTIAALNNDIGVVGVAPDVKIYALKVLDGNGYGKMSDVIAAIEWAVSNGIRITNNSYGSDGDPGSTVATVFKNAESDGVLHIAAAGNSGTCAGGEDNVSYPARYASVVAVSATNKNDSRPCFSSTGSAVELASPGVSINSAKSGGGYVEYSGTSMASPHVAGTAALIVAAGIRDGNNNGRINDEIRAVLQSTALDLGATGIDTFYGYGMVQPEKAIAFVAPTDPDQEPKQEEVTSEPKPEWKTDQNQSPTTPSVPTTPSPITPPVNLPAPALRHIPITPPGLRR